MLARVLRLSNRPVRRSAIAPRVWGVSATQARRWMGGSGGHDHGHGDGHGHSESLPNPRVKGIEDTRKTGPSMQERDVSSFDSPVSEEKWESVMNQFARKSNGDWMDASNPNWIKDIPNNLPNPYGPKRSKSDFVKGPFNPWAYAAAAALLGLVGAQIYSRKNNKPAYMEAVNAPSGLDDQKFVPLKLLEVRPYNHNTKQFIFELASPQARLELPTASFVLVKSGEKSADGKDVIRPYTPIDQHIRGQLHLLVKLYPNAAMGGYLFGLKPGSAVEFKGPIKKIPYTANMKKHIGMIAGGTGITPMLQVIDEVLSNPADNTQLTLLFGNESERDILLKERLDALADRYPQRFKVEYVITKPDLKWNGSTGFINADLITKHMPKPSNDSLVLVCGPPPMMKAISGDKVKSATGAMEQGPIEGVLKELNYDSKTVFKF